MRFLLCGASDIEDPPESFPIAAEGGPGVSEPYRPNPFVLASKQAAAAPDSEKKPETVGLLYDGSAPQDVFPPPPYNTNGASSYNATGV